MTTRPILRSSTSLVRLFVVGVCLLAAACSLVLDAAQPTQCRIDADCEAEPALRGRICASGYCVLPPKPVSAEGGTGCSSTASCTQANSNQASICKSVGSPCTPWQTPQCPFIFGAWDKPNAIMVGALVPLTFKQPQGGEPPKQPYGQRMARAIQLGLEELSAELPTGIIVGNERRPFALLECDSSGDADTARAAFAHLTDVVGAQAVVVAWDDDLAAIAAKATEKSTAIACADCLAPLPNGPLAWRIAPRIALEVAMIGRRIADVETTIRSAQNRDVSVALLLDPGRIPTAFSDAFTQRVTFNGGKTVAENLAAEKFRTFRSADPASPQYWAGEIRKFDPDIIVAVVGPDLPRHYLPEIEDNWASATKAKPTYLVTNMSRDSVNLYPATFTNRPSLRPRISGSRPYRTAELKANVDAFAVRYRTAFNFQQPDGNEAGYDAFYSLAYAITAASRDALLDGPHISAGFAQLVPATPTPDPAAIIDVGPGSVNKAVGRLANKDRIDLRGLYSTLDWDLVTRDLEWDVGTWCFQATGNEGEYVVNDDAGLRYSPKSESFTGAFSCP